MSTPNTQAATHQPNNQVNNVKPEETVDYWKNKYEAARKTITKKGNEVHKLKTKISSLEAENTVLSDSNVSLNLDEETKARLDDLMVSDPEAWRKELNRLETEAKNSVTSKVKDAKKQASEKTETELRQGLLDDFREQNPDTKLTNEVLALDIPARIAKKLETGEIDYTSYLQEAHDFIEQPKVVGNGQEVLGQQSLTEMGGGNDPTKSAIENDIYQAYEDADI